MYVTNILFLKIQEFYKYKTDNALDYRGKVSVIEDIFEELFKYDEKIDKSSFINDTDVPIMVNITFQGHSSSLRFSVSLVGDRNAIFDSFEVGQPTTLGRF